MNKQSAGILAYRMNGAVAEVLLVHPGGPIFARKDAGVWSIPKGEFEDGEAALDAAKREFEEEVGVPVAGAFTELTPIIQKSGKKVYAWAICTDVDTALFKSNTFTMEWPAKSGKWGEFPEVDKVAWLSVDEAKVKINPRQVPLIDELVEMLGSG